MNGSNLTNSTLGLLEDDYGTNTAVHLWLVASLIWLCIACDLFIIYIIKRTSTLKSYTGTLLISQTLSDVGIQIISLLKIAPGLIKINILSDVWHYALGLIGRALHGITCQTLAVICLNLYFAICHSSAYRERMSQRYVTIFVFGCWIFNICLCMTPLMSEQTRSSLYIIEQFNTLPVYKGSTLWAWIVIMADTYVVPSIITAFAFWRIRKYSRKIQTITTSNLYFRDKYKLSQIIAGISSCYIGIWSLMHMSRALQAKYEADDRGIFHKISLMAYFVNMAYDVFFKLAFYMWIYKPIRDTTIQLFRSKKITPVQVTIVSEARRAISGE